MIDYLKVVFITYLKVGIWGSTTIVFILFLRLVLKAVPRRMVCLLWLLAALRLLLPFSIDSNFSVQPRLEAEPHESLIDFVDISSDIPEQNDPVLPRPAETYGTDWLQWLSLIWLAVCIGGIVYTAASYLLLKRKLRCASCLAAGIYEDSYSCSAFLLGYFKPVIYLPENLDPEDRRMVILHEQAHLARGDNWWKLLGFLCVCVHWYNPVVWIGYMLLCQDIEVACDERVIGDMDAHTKKAYSMALLNCGKRIAALSACPVAFGEVNLKQRIKNILYYRKPGFWFAFAGILLLAVVAVCFLTSPEAYGSSLPEVLVQSDETTAPESTQMAVVVQPTDALEASDTEPPTEPTADQREAPVFEEQPEETAPSVNVKPEEPPVGNVSQTISIPEELKSVDTAPEPDTVEHAHSYSAVVYAPGCEKIGYTAHTCFCGHVYYTALISATGHCWEYVRQIDATVVSDGGTEYRCNVCERVKLDVSEPAGYTKWDLKEVDASVTQYAADLGFQTMQTHSNDTVKRFKYVEDAVSVSNAGGEMYLISKASSFVDQAYNYCIENGYSVSASVVWVEIFFYEHSDSIYILVYCASA